MAEGHTKSSYLPTYKISFLTSYNRFSISAGIIDTQPHQHRHINTHHPDSTILMVLAVLKYGAANIAILPPLPPNHHPKVTCYSLLFQQETLGAAERGD